MTTDNRKRAFLPVSAALTAALLLASCGGGGEEAPAPAPESSEQDTAAFNDHDVMFAQMMIPHHEQAVEMSRLARDRAGSEVRDLAADIEAAQGPEIERLESMLDSWGVEPADGTHHEGVAGMMTEEHMAELEQAEGEEFDTLFLEMMIGHHEGAVAMAEDELENGADPEALALAQEVVDAQEAEIEQMEEMLGEDGPDSGSASEEEQGER